MRRDASREKGMSREKGVDRREFIKASIAGLGMLAGTLTLGCAPAQSAGTGAAGSSSSTSSVASGDASSFSSGVASDTVSGSSSDTGPDAASGPSSSADSISAITMQVNGTSLQVTLADTQAASALVELLRDGPVSVPVQPYGGFEEVGPLPQALPADDLRVATAPGDVMLYQGSNITIFFGSNTWEYTRLGRIQDVTAEDLRGAFGEGDATIELSL